MVILPMLCEPNKIKMTGYFEELKLEFEKNANTEVALQQKAYMRNQFEFYGLKAKDRRAIQKPFLLQKNLPLKIEVPAIVKALWALPQRDYQHYAQELAFKYVKQIEQSDIELFEYMVTHKSWWDTVD